jgi:glycosyltransferase involved in cell wall biosynthesis
VKVTLDWLKKTTYDLTKVEIIAVDDHSQDHSFDILADYEKFFPNFFIARRKQNSGGASVPRNNGIKLATGKWILFLDSDDYLTEHALSDAMAIAESGDNDMVCMPYARGLGSTRAISKSAFSYPTTVTNLAFSQTKLYNSLNAVGKLFKRELIDKYQLDFPDSIKVREDNWFMMKMYSVSPKIAILGNQKTYYFIGEQDGESLSKAGTPPRDAVKIFLSVYDFIQALPIDEVKKLEFLALYLNRYTNFIKRGTFAPVRFFDHTKDTLKKLENHPLLDDNAQTFIQDLFHHKYDLEK